MDGKTIVEAVTEAGKYGQGDHWTTYLENGPLLDACVRNRLTGREGEAQRDFMCMRYGFVRVTKMGALFYVR